MVASELRSVPDKHQLAKDEYFTQPDGFPFEGFNLDDVLLPPNDDIGIDSDDGEVAEDNVDNVETGFGTAVAVDGLPVISEDKYEKLKGVLLKRFAPCGEIKEGCFWMPQDDKGTTKGYAFIEYSQREEALSAVDKLNELKLDKAHTIRVYLVDELSRLEQTPETYATPEVKPFDEKSHSDTMAWMMDKRGRDQFLIQHASEHEVCWNDAKKGEAEIFHSRSFWSDGPLTWSPQGSYIASMHRQGVMLWASKADGTFEKVTRFACQGVQKVDFSANEEYITCYSVVAANKTPEVLMTVFDCRSGRTLRVLQEKLPDLLVGSMLVNRNNIVVPFLAWSPTAPALVAKLAHNALQVFNGADMTLLDKQSIKLEGIADARWSPVDNVIAVYQVEHNNMPARVSLISLPEKKELRQKNLFMVSECKLVWHPQGKYLAVQASKLTKSKKSTYTVIELFTLKGKGDVTNDILEFPKKEDKVLQISWEPRGDRFAVIHGDPAFNRFNVSFYTMLDKTLKEGAKLLGTVSNRQVSALFWSPAGRNVLLAGLDGNAGALEFFNVDDMATLRTQQHFLCNNVKWDQTGRCVCSYVDDTRDMEHGYIIWSFTGEMLYRGRYDSFWNFAWRPRPPSQLPAEKEREILKNLKAYAKKYEEQDELLLAAADTELLARRQQKRAEWDAYISQKAAWKAKQEEYLESVLGYKPQEPAFELVEKDMQQVFDVREEPYSG